MILLAKKRNSIQQSKGDIAFNIVNGFLLALVSFICVYPFWDSFIVSFSSIQSYLSSSFHFWPNEWSLEPYKYMISRQELWQSYANSLIVTIGGTVLNMLVTVMGAYALSKPDLKGQRFFMFLVVFPMLFSGGMVPLYIVVDSLGLMNSLWSMVLPSLVNIFNLIVLRGFFLANPKEIEESAAIDGCSDFGILFRIVLPLSKPGLLTIALYYTMGHWSDFMSAILYITDREKWVLQLFLRSMLFESEAAFQVGGENLFLLGQPMKMAAVMMSIIPILLMYPFFQKYFTKGITAGAVKG